MRTKPTCNTSVFFVTQTNIWMLNACYVGPYIEELLCLIMVSKGNIQVTLESRVAIQLFEIYIYLKLSCKSCMIKLDTMLAIKWRQNTLVKVFLQMRV